MKNNNNNLKWLLLMLLSFSLTLMSCGGGGGGGGNPTAPSTGTTTGSISLSTDIPQALTTFTLSVSLSNETDLLTASLELDYNHSIIEMASVVSGGLLVDTNLVSFDSSNGNLLIAYANFPLSGGGAGPYTGSGTLLTITFNALQPGNTTINFSNTATEYFYSDGSTKTPLLPSQSISVQL